MLFSRAKKTLVYEKVPLLLTLGRLFVSPLFFVVYAKYSTFGISIRVLPLILIILFAISEISDFLDGFIARKYGLVTDLGKILDPMSDSVTRLTVLLTFTKGIVALPLYLIFIFVYRDAVVNTLRTLCALRGVALAARTSGKIKMIVQSVAIFSVLVLMMLYVLGSLYLSLFRSISFWIIFVASMYTLLTGVDYIYANIEYVKQALRVRRNPINSEPTKTKVVR